MAKTFGYDVGQAAGLLAGSQTISALLGTATEAINKLAISSDEKRRLLDAMTVAYAVTYIFGTAGTAWILASLGPRLVGGNVMAACREYEARMSVARRRIWRSSLPTARSPGARTSSLGIRGARVPTTSSSR